MSSEERKHTKGPWRLHTADPYTVLKDADIVPIPICTVSKDTKTSVEAKANAQLIASAPTLLESNERMKGLLQEVLPMLNHYRMHLGEDEDRADTKAADLITAIEQEIKP